MLCQGVLTSWGLILCNQGWWVTNFFDWQVIFYKNKVNEQVRKKYLANLKLLLDKTEIIRGDSRRRAFGTDASYTIAPWFVINSEGAGKFHNKA